MRRLLCAMALVVSCCAPAAALDSHDPAAAYYERCVAPQAEGGGVPDEGCDRLITDALLGITIGQLNEDPATFCYPQKLIDQMQAVDKVLQNPNGRPSEEDLRAAANFFHEMQAEMRAAVAQYMHEHSERLSEETIQVIFAALLHAFPCPGRG
jgi:hypothetical protein